MYSPLQGKARAQLYCIPGVDEGSRRNWPDIETACAVILGSGDEWSSFGVYNRGQLSKSVGSGRCRWHGEVGRSGNKTTTFLQGGDSGSFILDQDGFLMALGFGGSDTTGSGFIIPIEWVYRDIEARIPDASIVYPPLR